MAIVTEKTVWKGVPVRVETDMDTGQSTIRLENGIAVMNSVPGKASEWEYSGIGANREFQRAYNKSNPYGKITDINKFSQVVYGGRSDVSEGGGITSFNNTRSTTINDAKNYSGLDTQGIREKQSRLNRVSKVPGVIDPINNKIVNSKGEIIDAPVKTAPATLEDGTVKQSTTIVETDDKIEMSTTATMEEGDESVTVKPIKGPEESKAGPKNLGAANLRYPKDTPPAGFPFDFIKITAMKYVPSSLDYISSGGKTPPASPTSRIKKGNSNKKISQGSITLPMQPNLSETQSVGWGGDALDPFRAALANASMGAIQKFGEGDLMGAIQKVGGDIAKGAQKFASDPATLDFVAAYFAGRAVGSNITGRTTGQVINPNMELLFNGPTLRTFNFQFRMTPRYDKEAEEVRKIIKTFKANMAVQRSDSNLFLKTPNVFQLEYIANGGTPHPFLNKFKLCAMTSFNVNYTPDGSYMTYGDGSLTAYDMSMSFSELEPIYQDDYDDINGSTMGF